MEEKYHRLTKTQIKTYTNKQTSQTRLIIMLIPRRYLMGELIWH